MGLEADTVEKAEACEWVSPTCPRWPQGKAEVPLAFLVEVRKPTFQREEAGIWCPVAV